MKLGERRLLFLYPKFAKICRRRTTKLDLFGVLDHGKSTWDWGKEQRINMVYDREYSKACTVVYLYTVVVQRFLVSDPSFSIERTWAESGERDFSGRVACTEPRRFANGRER